MMIRRICRSILPGIALAGAIGATALAGPKGDDELIVTGSVRAGLAEERSDPTHAPLPSPDLRAKYQTQNNETRGSAPVSARAINTEPMPMIGLAGARSAVEAAAKGRAPDRAAAEFGAPSMKSGGGNAALKKLLRHF